MLLGPIARLGGQGKMKEARLAACVFRNAMNKNSLDLSRVCSAVGLQKRTHEETSNIAQNAQEKQRSE